jgi:HipA-like C-terminal domain
VDFCQLAGKDPEDKEASSAEECAALTRQYAGPEAAFALFRLLVFAYWVRNGDLHLKNLMLRKTLREPRTRHLSIPRVVCEPSPASRRTRPPAPPAGSKSGRPPPTIRPSSKLARRRGRT